MTTLLTWLLIAGVIACVIVVYLAVNQIINGCLDFWKACREIERGDRKPW